MYFVQFVVRFEFVSAVRETYQLRVCMLSPSTTIFIDLQFIYLYLQSTYLFEKIERTSISFWNYRLPLLSQFFWWFFTRFVNVIKTFNLSVLLDKIESCRLVWTRKKESGLLCMLFDSIENVDYVQTFRQQQKIHQKMHHIFSINSKSFNFNE